MQGVAGQKMIIYNIYKSTTVKAVNRCKKGFSFFCQGMIIRKLINSTMQFNAFPDRIRKIEFLSTLYKITDHIPNQNRWLLKRQVCMRQKIHVLNLQQFNSKPVPPTAPHVKAHH